MADDESGFDCLGAELIGFDYMQLAKAGSGLLSGFGGMMSGGGGGMSGAPGAGGTPAEAAAKQRLEDEKRQAEKSASTMKMVLGIAGAVVGTGLIATLLLRK